MVGEYGSWFSGGVESIVRIDSYSGTTRQACMTLTFDPSVTLILDAPEHVSKGTYTCGGDQKLLC